MAAVQRLVMRIRSVELFGFKSFPERTTLTFGAGISCIVGPNGCGKSNIADAIRWCLGTQSARSLRSSEMKEVIFSGSADRPPVGFAEVQLTFDADEEAPFGGPYVDASQVQIGRRLYRGGDNEYLINDKKCRRKDVIDFFLDTGLGQMLYSFIEQGQIGRIVHATAEERRRLVDEAAGISRFKVRRDEAQARLRATGVQLDRAADVTSEMGSRLRSLERQVVRAANFRRTRAQIKQLEITLALARYRALFADRRSLQQALVEARSEQAVLERKVAGRETQLQTLKTAVSELEEAITQGREIEFEWEATRRETESAREFTTRGIAALEQRLEENLGETEKDKQEIDEAGMLLASLKAQDAEHETGMEAAVSQRELAQAQLDRTDEELLQVQQDYATFQGQAQALLLEAQSCQTRLANHEERLVRVHQRKEALIGEMQAAHKAEDEGVFDLDEVAQKLADAIQECDHSEKQQQMLSERAASAKELAQQAQAALDGLIERQGREQGRQQSALKAQQEQFEQQLADVGRNRTEAIADDHRQATAHRQELEQQHRGRGDEIRAELQQARSRGEQWLRTLQAAQETELEATAFGYRQQEEATTAGLVQQQRSLHQDEQVLSDEQQEVALELEEQRKRSQSLTSEASFFEGQLEELRGRANAHCLVGVDTPLSLAERLELTPDERHWAPGALGERLVLPVVHTQEELLRLAGQLQPDVRLRLLWVQKDGDKSISPKDLLSKVTLVDSLKEALELHRSRGGAVVVRSTGERIYADGLVELGVGGEVGTTIIENEQSLAEVRSKQQALNVAIGQLVGKQEQQHDRRQQLLSQMEKTRTTLDVQRRQSDERVAAWLKEERRGMNARLERARSDVEEALQSLQALLETQWTQERGRVGALQAQEEERLAQARRVREAEQEETMLRLKTELHESDGSYRHRLDADRQALTQAREETLSVQSRFVQAQQDLHQIDQTLTELRAREASLIQQHRVLQESRQRHRASQEHIAQEQGALEEEVQEIVAQQVADTARLTEVKEQSAELGAKEREQQAQVDAARARQEEARAVLGQADIQFATVEERQRSKEINLDLARQRLQSAQQHHGERHMEMERLKRDIEEAHRAVAIHAEKLAGLAVSLKAQQEKNQTQQSLCTSKKNKFDEHEFGLKELRQEQQVATDRVRDLDFEVRELRGELTGLFEQMEERYQMSLPGLLDRLEAHRSLTLDVEQSIAKGVVIGKKTVAGVEALKITPALLSSEEGLADAVVRLKDQKDQLERIGEVNLTAWDEYEDLKERHGKLEEQRADLEQSVARIHQGITKLNQTCKERFALAFELVNGHFQTMYEQLAGGGRAWMTLTHEDELLTTGVEIFAQPPGKRLQSLSLLSGGEKAIVAIALLLAFFRVKPSPFCFLDEVDAPLDEANGRRLSELLQTMSQMSQFILITHHRKMMEHADTLYGVTMPTPGVSRLVSVSIAS